MRILLVLLATTLLAAADAAAPTFLGVQLGMTAAEVRKLPAAWGRKRTV